MWLGIGMDAISTAERATLIQLYQQVASPVFGSDKCTWTRVKRQSMHQSPIAGWQLISSGSGYGPYTYLVLDIPISSGKWLFEMTITKRTSAMAIGVVNQTEMDRDCGNGYDAEYDKAFYGFYHGGMPCSFCKCIAKVFSACVWHNCLADSV